MDGMFFSGMMLNNAAENQKSYNEMREIQGKPVDCYDYIKDDEDSVFAKIISRIKSIFSKE